MSATASTSPTARVLIVDDDPSVVASLSLLLLQRGYTTVSASGPDEALAALGESPVDLILQDMNFTRETSGEEGLQLIERIRAAGVDAPIVLITAWGSISLAVRGVKAGAIDFLTKPWDNDRLVKVIETALELRRSSDDGAGGDADSSREELDRRFDFQDIVGSDPSLMRILETVGRVSRTDASVLILGESGTGKELIAAALHRNSARSEGPFVKVNLGGISTALFESEMFGHARGAYTDAKADRVGRFAAAAGGTIFLDEIGDLEPAAQVKLLRVLQDGTFEVLGSSETRRVDVRVVAATNRDLARAVQDGTFREDLLYRLNLITLRLPSLRERRSDIPALANHFLRRATAAYGVEDAALEDDAIRWLSQLDWSGNIRELQQTIERAVLMSGKSRLTRDDFVDPQLAPAANPPGELPAPGRMTLDEIEKAMILKSLSHFDNNLSRAAEALGISRAALYRRLDKHGIVL